MAAEISPIASVESPTSPNYDKKSDVDKEDKLKMTYTSPLPPCKICGAKASGLHYGVNTCEACKGFFRRAIKFQKKYTCFRQKNCDILGGRSVRTSCPFCRLQKCLNMGMAHKAIKTGRYTHAKRTENIMEVKRLETASKFINFQSSDPQLESNTDPNLYQWKSSPTGFKQEADYDELNCSNHCMAAATNPIYSSSFQQLHSHDQNVYPHDKPSSNTIPSQPQQPPPSLLTQHCSNNISYDMPYDKTDNSTIIFNRCLNDEEHNNDMFLKPNTPLSYSSIPQDQFPMNSNYIHTNPTAMATANINQNVMINHSNPQIDSFLRSIPTPPLSSTHSGDNSPLSLSSDRTTFCLNSNDTLYSSSTTVAASGEPTCFLFSENTFKVSDSSQELNFTDSCDNEYPQLISLTSSVPSGPTPSPSALSSSSSGSSTLSSSLFEPAESPTSASPSSSLTLAASNSYATVTHAYLISRNMEETIFSVIESHRKHVITLAEYEKDYITSLQLEYVDRHREKEEMFGLMSHYVPDDEYKEIFHQTGLDVDGRHELRVFAYHSLGRFLESVISFAQSVPGFTSLCLNDQFGLLKVSNLEQWFMNAYSGVDHKHSVILMPNLKVFSFSEFSSLLGQTFADKCFELAPAFQKVAVPYEILVLWKIVLLFSTDRAELKEPEKVNQLQEAYLGILIKLIDRQSETPNMLSQIINLTVSLRDIDTAIPKIFSQDHILGIKAENLFLSSKPLSSIKRQ